MRTNSIGTIPACAVACLLNLGGCAMQPSPILAANDELAPGLIWEPQNQVLDEDLRPLLGFEAATMIRRNNRLSQVDVPVRCFAKGLLPVAYRFVFVDYNGKDVEPAMPWAAIYLEAGPSIPLTGRVPKRSVPANYRLEVRWIE